MNPRLHVKLAPRHKTANERVHAALKRHFPNVDVMVVVAIEPLTPDDDDYLLTTTRSYFDVACEIVERELAQWPSPMTPQDVADAVETVMRRAQARVGPGSIGAQQYSAPGQPQKFETMSLDGLLDYYQEELLDVINYSTMLVIRLDRMRAEMARRGADQ